MVKLTKIYTRTGDDGTTGLGDGSRVHKTDPRVEAYGTVDEANSALGLAITHASPSNPDHPQLTALLASIQHDLFDLGADLCCPITKDEPPGSRLRVAPDQTKRLELAIDRFNAPLGPLDSFILPGGSPFAAALHLARTVCRRAERLTSHLLSTHPNSTNPEALRYLNRLSDLLFVLARVANDSGKLDVKWIPGKHRS